MSAIDSLFTPIVIFHTNGAVEICQALNNQTKQFAHTNVGHVLYTPRVPKKRC